MSIKGSFVEEGRFSLFLDKRVRDLNHEKGVLLRENVKAEVIMVRDTKGLRR